MQNILIFFKEKINHTNHLAVIALISIYTEINVIVLPFSRSFVFKVNVVRKYSCSINEIMLDVLELKKSFTEGNA